MALFNRVCSYVSSPVYDTLLRLSVVCRRWRQLLDGDAHGRLDCWRHVPPARLAPNRHSRFVHLYSHKVLPPHFASALSSLRRIHSLRIAMTNVTLATGTTFFDLLFPHVRDSSSTTDSSTRVRLEHLRIDSIEVLSEPGGQPLKAVIAAFLLRTPPLRSAALPVSRGSSITVAALRHVAGSGRLLHLELRTEDLIAMVWGDDVDTTPLWRGATTVRSLVLNSLPPRAPQAPLAELDYKTDKMLTALEALPALTHLTLHIDNSPKDALQHTTQQLSDRLIFLRLHLKVPLRPSVALTCSALQSLCLTIDSEGQRGVLRVLDSLPLLPRLSQLAIQDTRDRSPIRPASLVLPPLPATLTYFQLFSWVNVSALSQPPGTTTVALHTALPPSLLCLSIALADESVFDTLLSSLPAQCPQLTHCFVGARVMHTPDWAQRVEVLKGQLGAGVWCDSENEVEQQRLDRLWQREAKMHVLWRRDP